MPSDSEFLFSSQNKMEMRVAGSSPPRKVAGALVMFLKKGLTVSLITIGPGPLNQALKGCIIARGMLADTGDDLVVQPSFRDESVKNADKTAIQTDVVLLPGRAPVLGTENRLDE